VLQKIECVQERLAGLVAAMQGVEDGNTVMPDHNRLAVQRERLGPQLGGGRGNRRIPIGPVIAAPGEEPHSLAVPAHDQPIAVVFGLVNPARPGRRLGNAGRNADLKTFRRHRILSI
jgi:hypothetical protein